MIAKWSDRIFHFVFFAVFMIITVSVIGSVCGTNATGIVFAVGFLLAGIAVFYLLYLRLSNISSRNLYIVFGIMFVCMLVLQFFIARSLLARPVTDLEVVHNIALNYAESGSMENMYDNLPDSNIGYMARYANNNGIVVLLSFYYRMVYLLLGRVPALAPVCLNQVFIAASVFLCFLIAKRILGNFGALITGVFCFFFIPYYTYTPYFYTDSLSMPFTVLSIYLFMCAYDCQKLVSKIVLYFATGVSVGIGYALKGSVIIVLVGLVIYLVLKGGIKKILLGAGVTLSGVLALTLCFNMVVSSLNMTTEEEIYEEKYPLTHWVMMGLNGVGTFSQDDSDFTRYAGNTDEKQAANIEVIKQRLSDYGVGGFLDHLLKKAVFTWDDGTYYINHHIYDYRGDRNILHEFILDDGEYNDIFYSISAGIQILILFMFCFTSLLAIIKPKVDYMTLIRGIIFGVMLFFLIWETRSRYLFNFTPLFILVLSQGMLTIVSSLSKFKERRRLEKRRTLA